MTTQPPMNPTLDQLQAAFKKKPAFASLNVEVGDANANGVADVRIMLRIGTLDLPPFVIDMDAGRAIGALLNVVSDWKLGLGR